MIKSRFVQLNIHTSISIRICTALQYLHITCHTNVRKVHSNLKNIKRMEELEAGGWGRHREFPRFQPRM